MYMYVYVCIYNIRFTCTCTCTDMLLCIYMCLVIQRMVLSIYHNTVRIFCESFVVTYIFIPVATLNNFPQM